MARTLINVPAKARKGEIIAIKALISHDMETGYRIDNVGKQIPRDIINLFVCSYNLLTVSLRLGIPLLLLISYVGSFADQRNSFRFAPTGIRTEEQLKALNIEYRIVATPSDLETGIPDSVRMMHALKQPIALLFTGNFTL